jgi:hypothetical protein
MPDIAPFKLVRYCKSCHFVVVQVTIYVRIVFLKVGEIDTLRDRFAADAFIQSKWREPAMDGKLRLVRYQCIQIRSSVALSFVVLTDVEHKNE